MTGRRCFYDEAVVEELQKHAWKKMIREVGGVPFAIEDDGDRGGKKSALLISDEPDLAR